MRIIFLILFFFQTILWAHSESDYGGLLSGLFHPIIGPDHLVVILGVGIWGYKMSKPSVWILPLAFITAMLLGAAIGTISMPLYSVEIVIAFSGIFLGLLIAMDEDFPLWISIPVVVTFALFYGFAHGVETPEGATTLIYMLGFLIASALLIFLGITIAKLLKKYFNSNLGAQIFDVLISLTGSLVLINILLA